MAGSGCTTPGMHRAVQQNLQAPNSWPKVLSVYMPWFGDHVHMDVGYSSVDPAVLRRQIQQARHSGISAFVVDWYGPAVPFSGSVTTSTWMWATPATIPQFSVARFNRHATAEFLRSSWIGTGLRRFGATSSGF